MKLPQVLLNNIQNAVNQIVQMGSRIPNTQSLLVAISGIDGSVQQLIMNNE
ncbi:MAG: hypothetical protein F6K40_07900 [Okeania sp. SIO3I5]|uniref:hypothetical protein n=1 Tax=Okeania sp. SIO3I5 TaxID=2607805 RepID=UPI0013BE28DA|nr:hypothetical protein [Okeania sp. SIO3I5]NEQ36214.1 hypothetical protein [Okeania sp. SIO3I5]